MLSLVLPLEPGPVGLADHRLKGTDMELLVLSVTDGVQPLHGMVGVPGVDWG